MRARPSGTRIQAEPGGTEKTEHPRPAHFPDQPGRGNAIGHRARDIGVAQAMIVSERIVPQVFRLQRRNADAGTLAFECF